MSAGTTERPRVLRFTAGASGFAGGAWEVSLAPLGLSPREVAGTELWTKDGAVAAVWQATGAHTAAVRLLRPLDPGAALGVEVRAARKGPTPAGRVTLHAGLDRLTFAADGDLFAVYNFLGARRPYFWPLRSVRGASVVRGQGTDDHPHHTGLNLAYGGHGEGGSTNIWSDWDEPPFGPGGRMLHLGFEQLAVGPVGASVAELLAYTDAQGEVFARERRRLFLWTDGGGRRYVDWRSDILENRDPGPQPFFFACRLANAMAVPARGRVEWREGRPWVAASGPAGTGGGAGDTQGTEGWHGVAILDHPGNPTYPSSAQRFAVAAQLTYSHRPPEPGAAWSLRHRVVVFPGAVETAALDALQRAYAEPCRVEWV